MNQSVKASPFGDPEDYCNALYFTKTNLKNIMEPTGRSIDKSKKSSCCSLRLFKAGQLLDRCSTDSSLCKQKSFLGQPIHSNIRLNATHIETETFSIHRNYSSKLAFLLDIHFYLKLPLPSEIVRFSLF